MKPTLVTLLFSLTAAPAWSAGSEAVIAAYQAEAGVALDTAQGESLWKRTGAEGRLCADCHGKDLRAEGKHAKTGKPIEPLAPSANPARMTDLKKVEKWFKRNCEWTWGRECTAQEKGHLAAWLSRQ